MEPVIIVGAGPVGLFAQMSALQFDPKVVEVFCGTDLAVWEKIRFETTRLMPPFDESRFPMPAR